jgi:hypothetical protein
MSCWTHIILEGYCVRTLSTKKDKFFYKVIDIKEFKTTKIKNPEYDSKYRTPKKPLYCPNVPQYLCLEKDCPYFSYTDAEKEDYLWMNKKYKKKVKK